MNIANKLTVFRMVLVPFFLLFILTDFIPYSRLIALCVFTVASITDKLDGTIARKYNMVTSFGKFMDPVADKLLVCSALICLGCSAEIPAIVVVIIIAREFVISGIRLVAAEKGVAIVASKWGKIKTIVQMTMIILILIDSSSLYVLSRIVMYFAVLLTVISLMDYIVKNKSILKFNAV